MTRETAKADLDIAAERTAAAKAAADAAMAAWNESQKAYRNLGATNRTASAQPSRPPCGAITTYGTMPLPSYGLHQALEALGLDQSTRPRCR
jgi:hypothetical protein